MTAKPKHTTGDKTGHVSIEDERKTIKERNKIVDQMGSNGNLNPRSEPDYNAFLLRCCLMAAPRPHRDRWIFFSNLFQHSCQNIPDESERVRSLKEVIGTIVEHGRLMNKWTSLETGF